MQQKKVKLIALLVGLTTLLVAGYFSYQKWSATHTELLLSGNVDIREVNLAFRVGGRVKEVLVDEGDVISAEGQVLASIDAEPYLNALNEAKANLATVQAQLDLMTAGYREEEVKQAWALLQAKQAYLANTKKMLNRQEGLAGTGAVPKSVLDDARAAYSSALAEVEAARQNHMALKKGFRVEEVEQAKAQVELAKARLDSAQLQYNDAQLVAPATGVIITRAIEAGSMVTAGTPALTLSLNSPVWVRAYVEEPYLGLVGTGTKVQIHTDTPSGKVYEGVVGFVSPTAEFTPKQVQTQDLRTGLVYRIRIVVQNPDDAIRQGMPVTVKLMP